MLSISRITRQVLAIAATLALTAGCARQTATVPTSTLPNATPVETAVPATVVPATEAPVPTEAPPPATTAPTVTPPMPDDETAAIQAALLAKFPETTSSVQCVQGDFAAAVVLPPPGGLHGIGAYLHRQDGAWNIAASGLGIFREDLIGLGFPEDFCGMPPAHDLPQPTAAPDPTTAAIVAAIQTQFPNAAVQIRCLQGDFAAAAVAPAGGQHGTGAYLRQQDGGWTVVSTGLGVTRDSLIALGFPEDFCGMPSADGAYEGPEYAAPDALLRAYYDAINAKAYGRAYGYWESPPSGVTFDEFAQGYADTASVAVQLGVIAEQGAAGSQYASIPTVLTATKTNGQVTLFSGCYLERKTNTAVDSSPRGGKWLLYRATIAEAPAEADAQGLLAQGCSS